MAMKEYRLGDIVAFTELIGVFVLFLFAAIGILSDNHAYSDFCYYGFLVMFFSMFLGIFFSDVKVKLPSFSQKRNKSTFTIDKAFEEQDPDAYLRLLELIDKFYANLKDLAGVMESVQNDSVRTSLSVLLRKSKKILSVVLKDKRRIRLARRFIEYYVPCALTLASAYTEMEDANIGDPSGIKRKRKIEKALDSISNVCDSTLTSVLRENFIDVDAELSVLNEMIAMDGLKEESHAN